MKLASIILFFTVLTIKGYSQSYSSPNPETGIAMGLGGGYSSKQAFIGTLSLGAMLPSQNHVSMNMVILNDLKNRDIPSIFEARAGHFFKTVEVYGGVGYHIAGSDNKIASNPATGVRPSFGITKHFLTSPWTLSAGMSGKIFSLQLGLFGVR